MARCRCDLTTERFNMSSLRIHAQRGSLLNTCSATVLTVKAVPRIESSFAAEADLRWPNGEALRLAISHLCKLDSAATTMAIPFLEDLLQHEREDARVNVPASNRLVVSRES